MSKCYFILHSRGKLIKVKNFSWKAFREDLQYRSARLNADRNIMKKWIWQSEVILFVLPPGSHLDDSTLNVCLLRNPLTYHFQQQWLSEIQIFRIPFLILSLLFCLSFISLFLYVTHHFGITVPRVQSAYVVQGSMLVRDKNYFYHILTAAYTYSIMMPMFKFRSKRYRINYIVFQPYWLYLRICLCCNLYKICRLVLW